MRPAEERLRVRELASQGHNFCEIARLTGIPRSTLRQWVNPTYRCKPRLTPWCPLCGLDEHDFSALPEWHYSYLLGIYLGDGTVTQLSRTRRFCVYIDSRYPNIIGEVFRATRAVLPQRRVNVRSHYRDNLVIISSYANAWGCFFPQMGPGRKHERKIELADWQQAIVTREPEQFIRGLIHSDGCRAINRVTIKGKEYRYPRYFFSQVSTDIEGLFCRTLEQLGIDYGFSSRGKDVTIHRRESVARLDAFVGPKA